MSLNSGTVATCVGAPEGSGDTSWTYNTVFSSRRSQTTFSVLRSIATTFD